MNQALRAVLVGLLSFGLIACRGAIGSVGDDRPDDPVNPTLRQPLESVLASNARRLSRDELDLSLGALLQTNRRYAAELLPEDDQEREGLFLHWAYDNRYTNQPAEKVLVQAYESLARNAATDLVADPERRALVLPCEPTGPGDSACFEAFLRSFGRRAFRRAMSDEEVTRMMPLFDEAAQDDDFYSAVDVAVRAFLQAPDFLYRIEIGTELADHPDVRVLDGYEIATRMAFLLWGSGPDDALLDMAEAGALLSSDGRRSVALTMLDDPRALDQVERFHSLWLGFRQLPHSPELTTSMRLETRALLERVIFDEDAPYMDVFRANDTFVDPLLAEHYGLTLPGSEPAFVAYEDSALGGLLSHGSLFGAFSTGGDTSTTRRGVFVRERLMCQTIPPPPTNVNVDDLPETDCKSELIEVHQMGACGGCHSLMDPIGWGLENYDLAGVRREHDTDKPECVIDGAGALDGRPFTGPRELSELLIASGELETCAIRQVLRFAAGREELPDDASFLSELTVGRVGTDWTFRDLLTDIVANERFAHVREDITDGE